MADAQRTIEPVSGGFQPLGAARAIRTGGNSVRLKAGAAHVEVAALAPDLFRVGMFPNGRRISFRSAAVVQDRWTPIEASIDQQDGEIRLVTSSSSACIRLDPLRVSFQDAAGRVIAEDDPELGMGVIETGEPLGGIPEAVGRPVRVYKRHQAGERYFGGGERTGGLEKTGSRQVFWNIDPPIGHTAEHDNLYSSIPFITVLGGGRAWGIFVDNPSRLEFDLALEDPNRASFTAGNGDLIYYVFTGPTPAAVLDRYTELTGRTPLPPLWALGNHHSSWNYESADDFARVARQFRERDIPCDAIYLDIDYMDGYRVFTWDRERFPDPEGFVASMADLGLHVVTIVDPGVKVDETYEVYTGGRASGYFCQTLAGEEYHNVVWPGVCAFPDFTDPDVRAWWGDLHRALLDVGVAGIWCDMNEPALSIPALSTMPPDVVHNDGGEPKLHAQVHNIYGLQMARAAYEGMERLRPERRPVVISRSGYAGLQRYALQWTGDNSSWWEHIAMGMPQLQNMGLSGIAWCGVDVGGFWGDTSGELFTRWLEFGIFQPFCRNHSVKGSRQQEPWSYGERYESIARDMLKLRQRLIPYLYSVFEECHRTGAPVMRPLLFAYPDDEVTYARDDQFLVGDALLVAPVTQHGTDYRYVYLPEGTWAHFWTRERFTGPCHILAHAPLGQPPLYVRANSPLPLWPDMNHVGERRPDPLTLLIHPAEGEGSLTLYEDAGEGYDYQRGQYARTLITCQSSATGVRVYFAEREGDFTPDRDQIELVIAGLSQRPAHILVDGDPAPSTFDHDTLTLRIYESASPRTVELRFTPE